MYILTFTSHPDPKSVMMVPVLHIEKRKWNPEQYEAPVRLSDQCLEMI